MTEVQEIMRGKFNNNLVSLYAELGFQVNGNGESLGLPLCESVIEQIEHDYGFFDQDLIGKDVFMVYTKKDVKKAFIIVQDAKSWYWLDTFSEKDGVATPLTKFADKSMLSEDEVVAYIDDIVANSDLSPGGKLELNVEQTALLWLMNSDSENLKIQGLSIWREDNWITGVTPYGEDALICQAENGFFNSHAESIAKWVQFWEQPRDEHGSLIDC